MNFKIKISVLLLSGVLCAGSLSCFGRPEAPPPTWVTHTSGSHRIRIHDSSDQLISTLRFDRRMAVLDDAHGVRLGRAKALGHRVVVMDRSARPRLVFRSDEPVEGSGQDTRSLWVEDSAAQPLAFFQFDRERQLSLYTAAGAPLGSVRLADPGAGRDSMPRSSGLNDPGSVDCDAEVLSVADDAVLACVRRTSSREQTIVGPQGEPMGRFTGFPLEPWLVAATRLGPPSALEDVDEPLYLLGLILTLYRCQATESCFPG